MSAELRPVLAITALLLLAGLSAGCGGGGSSAREGAGAPRPGGTLHLAQSGEISTLDPPEVLEEQSAHVVGQIMEPLFKTDSAGKVRPWLASTYKQSSDHLTWTLSLRKGVRFTNGDPLTASDVVFSLDRVGKSASWSFLYESIAEVSAPSADTVVIKTTKPMPGLPTVLSLFAADIIPKNFGGMTEKQFASHPIGTGPFKFVRWDRGTALTWNVTRHIGSPAARCCSNLCSTPPRKTTAASPSSKAAA